MKPTLSILMPGIRVERWQAVYDSLERAYSGPFELVTCGPNPCVIKLNRGAFQSIRDMGSPIRCQQLALLACHGEYITWASDDGIWEPYALDDSMRLMEESGYDPHVAVTGRYTESETPSPDMLTDDYYYFRNHRNLADLQVPGDYLAFNGPWIVQRDVLMNIGGLDCRFEGIAMAYCDLGARLQNSGVKCVLQDGRMVRFGHMPLETGDHGPIHRAYVENDLPYFREIYGGETALKRTNIPLDNWQDAPARWSRRFGKVHVVTPFSRQENCEKLYAMLSNQEIDSWILLRKEGEPDLDTQSGWASQYILDVPDGGDIGMKLVNRYIQQGNFAPDDYYYFLMDDDWLPPGLVKEIRKHDENVVITSLNRGDNAKKHPSHRLVAARENLKYGEVALEQAWFKGRALNMLAKDITDLDTFNEQLVINAANHYPTAFRPDLEAWFNYLEEGRWGKSVDAGDKTA